MGVSVAPSCRGYELWQQPRFAYMYSFKNIFLKKNSLEVEMHTGISWATEVIQTSLNNKLTLYVMKIIQKIQNEKDILNKNK